MMQKSEKILQNKEVKPTAMRLLVLNEFMKTAEAKTLQDIEDALPTADKVTIYRTVKTFVDNYILHPVVLPEGQTKYALCNHEGKEHSVHPHFTCLRCGQTKCLPETELMLKFLPDSYEIKEAILMLSGYCTACSS